MSKLLVLAASVLPGTAGGLSLRTSSQWGLIPTPAEAPMSPTLYCWQLVGTKGERQLLEVQERLKTSIFACNGYDVFTPERMLLPGYPRYSIPVGNLSHILCKK